MDTGGEAPKCWYTYSRDDEDKALTKLRLALAALSAAATSSDGGSFAFRGDHVSFSVQPFQRAGRGVELSVASRRL